MLGMPSADKDKQKEKIRLERQDARERNSVEGKFGERKRHYGLAWHSLNFLMSYYLRHFWVVNSALFRPQLCVPC